MSKKLLSVSHVFIFLVGGINMAMLNADAVKYSYPITRQDNIVDDFHGTKVADPYRWLEEQNSDETKAWVDAQVKLTDDFFVTCSAREKIKERLTKLWNYKKISAPSKVGDYYFYSKNDGLQNQSVLYRVKNLTETPVVVLDPNTFSNDGTVSIENTVITEDGSIIAYALSTHGSDWKEIKILNIDSGIMYPETLVDCKFTSFSWKHDNSGFFYNRFSPVDDFEDGVYWHALGTDQATDQLIYKNDQKDFIHAPCVTEDGKYLILVTVTGCSTKNNVAYRSIDSDGDFIKVFDGFQNKYDFIGNVDSTFYFLTDSDASPGRVISLDVNQRLTDVQEVIPQSKNILSSMAIINNRLVGHFMQDAHSRISVYNLDGTYLNDIALPTVGSAGFSGRQKSAELFISFTSFLYPSTVFRYDFATNALTQVWDVGVKFDPSGYETKQVFYQSADGVTVPMFITHKKDMNMDGNNPTFLYAYGGFAVDITPFFSLAAVNWLEQGGVFVVANIRGGGEYGQEWHESAIIEKRQNAFNDFIAAGEWLINNNYTNSSKLAINGGSNGGLLVGVCMQQRPDLFGAVVSDVPVVDMLRFPLFTGGRYWMTEYGDVTNPEHFKALYGYSPVHTVKAGVKYPPIMVTSADTDTRVVPLHAKKWVASLQTASTGENLVLLRYDTKSGHGAGKPTAKIIEGLSDKYAFLFKVLGMEFKDVQ